MDKVKPGTMVRLHSAILALYLRVECREEHILETPYHALQTSRLQMRLERRRSLKMSMLGGTVMPSIGSSVLNGSRCLALQSSSKHLGN
jgi:hypothetical protein